MKALFAFAFLLIGTIGFAQITVDTLTRDQYQGTRIGDSCLEIAFVTDTMDASADPDTFLIDVPQEIFTQMGAICHVRIDTVPGETALDLDYFIRNGQCRTCPYVEVTGTANTDPAVWVTDTFAVNDTKMWIELIAQDGIGTASFNMTLKPQ